MGEAKADKCPNCGSEDNTGVAFLCGTMVVGDRVMQSDECRQACRQHAEDLAVDDEINRRRERRHFEPDHFGV